MKYFCFGILSFLLMGCSPLVENQTLSNPPPSVVIDGCQYLNNQTTHGYRVYTHKGNCTNCQAYLRKLLKDE